MKSVMVTGPGTTEIVEVEQPVAGPRDVLVRIRACGICGSDHMYTMYGGIPPRQGATPLGHEPAGEIVFVGDEVQGAQVGDHVVINPMAASDGIIGSGGAQGAFSPFVVLFDAVAGTHFRVIPNEIPFEVAALNEPMAVARHAVNRSGAKAGEKAVVFGAGPIGLGALLSLKAKGVDHVVVIDILPTRLEKALAIGADAVINSAEEDVKARLIELHGEAPPVVGIRDARPATDVYLDAAGAPVVPTTVFGLVKQGARLVIPAVHKKPVEVDFGGLLTTEISIIMSMGYPTEIFEVTDDLIANWQKYQLIISDRFTIDDVQRALEVAATPGAADKVMVTLD
ncbi:zinc-binding dehydrogenase [Agromyces sp. Leaf222]|uniref:zinc-dependent alcohol dehydrogenase n=1 Tax=Agromyces sp. Leaf222 TaxID=1735688 RepID=UPI0006FC76A0|nr:zinc-binding dehydrogenase [Agromyces sp. Leaf222]KQM84549.1 theronine dehydrogenase [Agromyces sp. Leaf222]